MSINIGRKTNTDTNGHGYGKAFSMSIGLPIRKKCLACGEPKKAGTSHPKCSRVLQEMNRRGEL